MRHFTHFGLDSVIGPLDLTIISPQVLLVSRKVAAEATALVGAAQLPLFLSFIKLGSFRVRLLARLQTQLGTGSGCWRSWVW